MVEDGEKSAGVGADALIVAKTTLRVCRTPTGQCVDCEALHLCKYLVCGNCIRDKCKNPHSLDSSHNSALLKKLGLQQLGEKALFQLLMQNDPCLLPEVCTQYNKGNGCKYQTSCTNLHVCQHFLQDDCKFGADCKRAHSFDDTDQKIFISRGLSLENIINIHKIYKNRFMIHSPEKKPPSPNFPAKKVRLTKRVSPRTVAKVNPKPEIEREPNEICLLFIRKSCSFKDKCVHIHHHLPYKWQILGKNGYRWKDLRNGEAIERAFCNPANDMSPGPQTVNFISMTCGGSKVRRLSTASSITKPPDVILTTEWLWYWKNEREEWSEYGQGEDVKLATPLTSQTLENIYQSNVQSEVPVSSKKHSYMLYLKDMYQKNFQFQTKREIRRRPRFVSALEVKSKLKSESSSSSVSVPAHWDRGALPNLSYRLVPLSRTEAEFRRLKTLFKRTMPEYKINSIQRNQNSSLWKAFQWQKNQMKKRNGGKEVCEKLLFHGTKQSLVNRICKQNFDWSLCGVNGTLYGKGSYFATEASFSNYYAKSTDISKEILVARVLVGHYATGHSSLVHPPRKSNGFYDSCVNNCSNPKIFVIFNKYQIYPEFIIKYTLGDV
ncbi:protein mono-ADP-ribosyltransferase PARP12-like [Clarias gariepinus]|uniref:protein mono-ADP-ribosyltransferase PARP12-like n=1 Tax=Clarias gariepinus TaxID=13013 RepID=UPI00234D063B|nr:protein mono-ADP-ribosyltransferase PARP12-like [Clarias gariepinus]